VTLPANVTGGASTVYNADNAQTKFNGTALNYDANGNLTSDGTNTYTWDARNHLTAISGGSAATFTYDGFGRRVKKVIGGTTTQFLYDGLNPVQELNGKHNAAAIANLLTGLSVDEYFTRTDSSGTMAFLADALGSTVGLVGSGGSIATNYTYQPFGATTVGGSANGNSYQFTGRENDATGLYYYRARYYSPTYQRFIAQDPSGFGGGDVNAYDYVGANPMNSADPSGLQAVPVPGPILPLPPIFVPGTPANQQFTSGTLNLLHQLEDTIANLCKDDKKDQCWDRYQAEKDYCFRNFKSNPRVGMCLDRAYWRYRSCLDGLDDPGPLDPRDWPDSTR
jgi:RHS repeat-associated protein